MKIKSKNSVAALVKTSAPAHDPGNPPAFNLVTCQLEECTQEHEISFPLFHENASSFVKTRYRHIHSNHGKELSFLLLFVSSTRDKHQLLVEIYRHGERPLRSTSPSSNLVNALYVE